jgi:hypothetical protein
VDYVLPFVLPVATLGLLVSAFIIQKRNRSPYSNEKMDEASLKRFRVGQRLGLLGILSYLANELIRAWR